jgi:hypothetical protein
VQRGEDLTQEDPELPEDEAGVVADRGEDGIGEVAVTAFEVVSARDGLRSSGVRSGLDRRAKSELALYGAVHAAPPPRE